MILIYILELLFQNVNFFPVWKRKKFQQPCKIFSRPNSGDKKMKFYILELFLKSGEDFSLKLFFQKFF